MDNNEVARFPIQLHGVLEMATKDTQLWDVISWLPCGTAFAISDQLAFRQITLPVHFASMHSFKSFRRQLNLYGFNKQFNKESCKRVCGAYGHPLFLRDRSDLAAQISRAPNTSKSSWRQHGGSKALQQDSSACSDTTGSLDTRNKGFPFKLDDLEYPSTDRMTLTANSISVILSELERNDVFVGPPLASPERPLHAPLDPLSSDDVTKDHSLNTMSISQGPCCSESLFMPSWCRMEYRCSTTTNRY